MRQESLDVQVKLGRKLLVLTITSLRHNSPSRYSQLELSRMILQGAPSRPRINEFKCGPFGKGPTATPSFRLKAKETDVYKITDL